LLTSGDESGRPLLGRSRIVTRLHFGTQPWITLRHLGASTGVFLPNHALGNTYRPAGPFYF
jgi:hypothetical protein